jgi:hypothetical protein
MQMQLERERMASAERIAQIEAHSRLPPARGSRLDAEDLARRIDALGERLEEAIENLEDAPPSSAPPPADASHTQSTAAIVTALKDTLQPIIELVIGKLAAGPTLPDTTLPPLADGKDEKDDGKDPTGEPN